MSASAASVIDVPQALPRRQHAGHEGSRSLLQLEAVPPAESSPVALPPGRFVLGSAADCDLRLTAHGIQPHHCLILTGARKTILKGWDPRTWVNDAPARETELRSGDRLTIGPVSFLVRAAEPEAADDEQNPGRTTLKKLEQELHSGTRGKPHLQARKETPGSDAERAGALELKRVMQAQLLKLEEQITAQQQRLNIVLQEQQQSAAAEKLQSASLAEARLTAAQRKESLIADLTATLQTDAERVREAEQSLRRQRHEWEREQAQRATALQRREETLERLRTELEMRRAEHARRQRLFTELTIEQTALQAESLAMRTRLESLRHELRERESGLHARESALEERLRDVAARDGVLASRELDAERWERTLGQRAAELEQQAELLSADRNKLEASRAEIEAESESLERAQTELERLQQNIEDQQAAWSAADIEQKQKLEELLRQETVLRQQQKSLCDEHGELECLRVSLLGEWDACTAERESLALEKAEVEHERAALEESRLQFVEERARLLDQRQKLLSRQENVGREQPEATGQAGYETDAADATLIEARLAEIEIRSGDLATREEQLASRDAELREEAVRLESERDALAEREAELVSRQTAAAAAAERAGQQRLHIEAAALESARAELAADELRLQEFGRELQARQSEVEQERERLEWRETELQRQREVLESERTLLEARAEEVLLERRGLQLDRDQIEIEQEQAALQAAALRLGNAESEDCEESRETEWKQRWSDREAALEARQREFTEAQQRLDAERAALAGEWDEVNCERAALKEERSALEAARGLHPDEVVCSAIPGDGEQRATTSIAAPESTLDHSADEAQTADSRESAIWQFLADEPDMSEEGDLPEVPSRSHDEEPGSGAAAECEELEVEPSPPEDQVLELRSQLAELFNIQKRPEARTPEPQAQTSSRRESAPPAQVSRNTELHRNEQTAADDDADSVATYMERLLARTRRPAGAPPHEPAASPASAAKTAAVAQAPHQPVAAPPSEDRAEEQTEAEAIARRPRPAPDKDEMRAHLDSFRHVANLSARTAIARHTTRRLRETILVKSILAVVSLGLSAFLFAGGFWGSTAYVLNGSISAGVALGLLAAIIRSLAGGLKTIGRAKANHRSLSESPSHGGDPGESNDAAASSGRSEAGE